MYACNYSIRTLKKTSIELLELFALYLVLMKFENIFSLIFELVIFTCLVRLQFV